MPNLPISDLPELSSITENTEFVIQQLSLNFKIKSDVLFSNRAYGYYLSTDSQYSSDVNQSYPVYFNMTNYSNNIIKTDNHKFRVAQSGLYEIQFFTSISINSFLLSGIIVTFWINKNGENVSYMGKKHFIDPFESSTSAFSGGFFIYLTESDYFELMWNTTSIQSYLEYRPDTGNIWPALPSVSMSIIQN